MDNTFSSSDMVVVVPTRGRPASARRLATAFRATCTGSTRLVLAVDSDDEHVQDYVQQVFGGPDGTDDVGDLTLVEDGELDLAVLTRGADDPVITIGTNKGFTQALNRTALHVAARSEAFAIGCMNDDHVPRSTGWDAAFVAALQVMGTGIAYGNDLFQGGKLPTQLAMTSDIVRRLGYYGPPVFQHLYVDDVWLAWGRALRCLTYLPEAVIEHLHPAAGKGEWSEGHLRVNSDDAYARGARSFAEYMQRGLVDDLAKIQELVLARTPALAR